ncbi:hypothetical protein DV738_g4356, partial [Chaetothyriales sp. CBS 135597]
MPLSYNPSHPGAYNSVWGPVFLSSRDITGQVPINKVEYPGVNVQAVCSPDNVFEHDRYRRCLSDLLGAQARWFIFDIYWDYTNRQFGLCPVQLPSQDPNTTSTTTTAATRPRDDAIDGSEADANADGLLQLGPYQCSDSLTFDAVLDLFHNYFSATSSKVLARVVQFKLNLHAAALPSQPEDPAPTPTEDQMPTSSELVGHLLNSDEMQPFVYPFSELLSDRSNLNVSWYAPDDPYAMQSTRYFNTSLTSITNMTTTGNSTNIDVLSTQDGWPSELHLLFSKYYRLLVTWGTVDDQMAAYDFASDSSTVFPRDYMSTEHTFQADATTGALSSGCFYDDTTTNSSAASATAYLDFTAASVLGWAPGEPQNSSSVPRAQLHGHASQFRCAVIDSSPAYAGHWRVANCQQRFVAACRVDTEPFRWRLTQHAVTFHDAPAACQSAVAAAASSSDTDTDTVFVFDQPHTGLENTYLHHYILSQSAAAAWINLNSLSSEGCWVTTGPNGTCKYTNDLDIVNDRRILIPTIGALIILILVVLTALAKCNSNYRHNRKTKTGPGGWEYEGVPS